MSSTKHYGRKAKQRVMDQHGGTLMNVTIHGIKKTNHGVQGIMYWAGRTLPVKKSKVAFQDLTDEAYWRTVLPATLVSL